MAKLQNRHAYVQYQQTTFSCYFISINNIIIYLYRYIKYLFYLKQSYISTFDRPMIVSTAGWACADVGMVLSFVFVFILTTVIVVILQVNLFTPSCFLRYRNAAVFFSEFWRSKTVFPIPCHFVYIKSSVKHGTCQMFQAISRNRGKLWTNTNILHLFSQATFDFQS
jgi:hypothetical protein